MSNYIFGLHDGGEKLMLESGKPGTIVLPIEVGHGPDPHLGLDLTFYANQGITYIIRIQHAWGTGWCIPQEKDIDGFMNRIASLVAHTQGCKIWLYANEPNHKQEWPNGEALSPGYVARTYDRCRELIHAQFGHEGDIVLLPAIGPWNDQIGIGWITYFKAVISLCKDIDGFALHTYSRGADPSSIVSEDRMGAPYQMYHSGFRTYIDWMQAIPAKYSDKPVFITETDQNQPWVNANTGWVQAAYAEINRWNANPGIQQIRSMVLYRWPNYDQYGFEKKSGVHEDFRAAMKNDYQWKSGVPVQPTEIERLKTENQALRIENMGLRERLGEIAKLAKV